MTSRPTRPGVAQISAQIGRRLREFAVDLRGKQMREAVLALVKVRHLVNDLAISALSDIGLDRRSAKDRIRAYFIDNVGVAIDSEELAIVGGISEFGRRIRELRVEEGFRIVSGASADDESGLVLKPDQYMLLDPKPDTDAAARWRSANEIRRLRVGSKEKIRRFLVKFVGKQITTEELAYVSGEKREFARRLRELRVDDGYPITTQHTGRPDLPQGVYVLESATPRTDPRSRAIPRDVERAVYARDNHRCVECGWAWSELTPGDPRSLALHHKKHYEDGGPNTVDNLEVLCTRCHQEHHRDARRRNRRRG